MKTKRHTSRQLLIFTGKLALIFLVFVVQGFRSAGTFDLTVKITNLGNTKGAVEIGLYNQATNFPSPGKQWKMARPSVNGNVVTYNFRDLPAGDYAIATYHDENGDGKCNKNMFGVPTEAYAFSNDVRPFLSAPNYSSCRFWLTENRTLNIKMVY
jgi:uncharacterized protein (DUF2141 family)